MSIFGSFSFNKDVLSCHSKVFPPFIKDNHFVNEIVPPRTRSARLNPDQKLLFLYKGRLLAWCCQASSQPVSSGKPEGPFCLSCTFIFRNERNWMKKSARVTVKLVSPGLPGLQVATRLVALI